MAPEVLAGQSYDAKADLWSIGTIVYECLTGKSPPHASYRFPPGTSSALQNLIAGLIWRNPAERMSFDVFFRHQFLQHSHHAASGGHSSNPVPSHQQLLRQSHREPSRGHSSSSGSGHSSSSGSSRHVSSSSGHRWIRSSVRQPVPDWAILAGYDSDGSKIYIGR
jgi:serine/threonine protein kinase